ncbi:MAG: prenyltransferase/squalene oxidase repeat-containing protein [Parcubacteria group bacterium]
MRRPWFIAVPVGFLMLGLVLINKGWNASDQSLNIQSKELSTSVRNGVRYLVKALKEDHTTLACYVGGRKVEGLHGYGHVFALHFMVNAIENILTTSEKARLATRIRLMRREGLWGYTMSAPVDSDDTAFALRLLSILGEKLEPEAYHYLMRFYNPKQRVFRTFLKGTRDDMPRVPSVSGNLAAHPEVNANILLLLHNLGETLPVDVNHIVSASQAGDGSLVSYFYPSPYYAAIWLLPLIADKANLKTALHRVVAHIHEKQNSNGSCGASSNAYDTALALNALNAVSIWDEAYRRGVSYLVGEQRSDGSWRSNEVIWRYVAEDRPKRVWEAYDNYGVITTSLAVQAIRAYLKAFPSPVI